MELKINLFGIDIDSALLLTEPLISKYGVKVARSTHAGGWSVLKLMDNESSRAFVSEVEALFYPKATSKTPFEFAYDQLLKRGLKITFAESCTGGLLSALFTQVAGFSRVFDGGLVTYSNHLKTQWLGVEPFVLERYGAVSAQCVEQMCEGALVRTEADISVAISGIAGPDGGTSEKPVGTVFIGVAQKGEKAFVEEFRFRGDRKQVQTQAAFNALRITLNQILQN